ncbi:P22 phage major capsid protein family protein [Rhizobium leguminosarum]
MSNTILTPTAVTREALRILHQKLNFIGSINRQYDDSFAKSGAKIGDTLKIRMPNRYTVRTGKTISTQDTAEDSQSLQVATQKGVDVNFSSAELTLSLDDFSKRILDPAMAVLAANVEYDAMTMFKDVYNAIWTPASTLAYNDVLSGRVLMQRGLAPLNDRSANLNSLDMSTLVKDTKTLFNDQSQVAKQYKEGYMGRAAGYDFMENTLWPGFTRGAADANYVVNTSTGITSGSATVAVTAGTGTLLKGDIITIVGVNSVHPETKVDNGVLQQFVIVSDYAGGAGNITVSPTPVTSGAKQNVVINSAGAGKAVVVAGTASGQDTTSLLYQQDAFTFATADLVMPGGVDFARREVQDGISLRIVRQYDINNDNLPCRIDVLYGYKTLRPEWATRLHFN